MKDYRDKEMKNLIYMLFFLFLIWCTPILEHINDSSLNRGAKVHT